MRYYSLIANPKCRYDEREYQLVLFRLQPLGHITASWVNAALWLPKTNWCKGTKILNFFLVFKVFFKSQLLMLLRTGKILQFI